MNLQILLKAMEEHMRSIGYAETTITAHKYSWHQFSLYCDQKGITEFSFDVATIFAKEHYGVDFYKNTTSHSQRESHVFRVFKSLDEFQSGLPISCYRKNVNVALPSQFAEAIQAYLDEYGKRVKKCSVDDAAYTLRTFAEFLTKQNVNSLDQVEVTHITDFRASMHNYVSTTQNSWMSMIRKFFLFAYENGYAKRDLSIFVAKRRYEPSIKLPSLYTEEEIAAMLAVVDRNNPCGKRNYAILLIAARLGMRSGDISNLKFENIHWDKNELVFIQEKTGYPQTLPLPNDVGEAIVSYLQNGRPFSDEKYIFLKSNAPFTPLSAAALHPIMKKYAQLAKIKNDPPRKYGLHAFRHSLASNLLNNNTPLPVISEILGHQKTETTSIYAKVDVNSLSKCTLEIPLPIQKGDMVNE